MRPVWRSAVPGFLLSSAFAAALVVSAQQPGRQPAPPLSQLVHDRWTQRDGLPHNLVERVVASRRGYLWLGTQEGLVRFDGVRFRLFERGATPGLAGDEIFALHETPAGTLWIGTSSGLSRMSDERFERVDPGGGAIAVHALESDGADLWAGTRTGLRRLRAGSWSSFTAADGLPDERVSSLARAVGGGLWIGTRRGVARLHEGRLQAVPSPGLPSGPVSAVHETGEGSLWAGTPHGLFRRRPREGRFERVPGVGDREISWLLSDRTLALWISTTTGMLRLDDGKVESLSSQAVITNGIAEDGEGSIWFGTATEGLHRIGRGNVVAISREEGLSSEVVWSVAPAAAGGTWVAGDGGLDRVEGRPAAAARELTRGANLTALLEDRDGFLWVGTEAHGVIRIAPRGSRRFGAADGVRTMVRVLYQDRGGAVWLGGRDGLHRFVPGAERFESFAPTSGLVNVIAEDGNGRLWVGTTAGLWKTSGSGLEAASLRAWSAPADVTALRIDPDGTLWAGTIGAGLWRVREGREDGFARRNGMHENQVFAILDDGLGYLWLSGNHGITRVSRDDLDAVASGRRAALTPMILGRSDGMKEAECSGGVQPSASRDATGRLWFATIRGVNVVDPARLIFNPAPPSVVLEEVVADGKRYRPGPGLRLPAGTRHLEIRYTGLGLAGADRIRFRHRLEGLDEEFVEAGSERVAHYAGLGSGRWVFRLRAANENGVWNETGTSLTFDIEPQLWQATWVRFVAAAVLLGLIVAGFLLRIRSLGARERTLNLLVAEKTAALEEEKRIAQEANQRLADSNLQLERLSAQDPLTGLANRRQFDLVFEQEWRRCWRAGQPLSAVMIDIDHFKAYNDAFGHQAGDRCLKEVSAALAGGLRRAGDALARYGGEEFVVLLPATPLGEALAVAEALRRHVMALGIEHVAPVPGSVVTVSAGVASVQPADGPPESLAEAADAALYEAKRQGRNRTVAVS